MMRKIAVFCILFVMICSSKAAAGEVSPTGSVCWPMHFAGITVGINNDSHVVRLLGAGLFRKEEGDTGGRIFIDKGHSATLHVVFYTDKVVGELTIFTGVEPLSETEQKKAESQYFNPTGGFGNWHALHLGSKQEDVINNLGKPKSIDENHGWKYLTNCSCEIQDFFTIYFKDGRISKVIFSSPPG